MIGEVRATKDDASSAVNYCDLNILHAKIFKPYDHTKRD